MLRALTAAVIAAAVLAVPAAASERATPAQKRQIAKAMRTTNVGGGLNPRWYRVIGARVSTVSDSWATARQRATRAGRGKFQPAYVILVQPAGTKQWVVVDLGTALVGCGIAPNAVVKDLVGACPPGEGVS